MMPRTHLFVLIALVLAEFLFSAVLYPHLPNPAPIHWNWRGEADGFGSPWLDALLLPVCAVVLAALLVFLPLLGPFRSNFARFSRTYGRMAVTVAAALLAIHVVLMLKATGRPVRIERAFPVILGLLMAALGNGMGKIRRNSYVGIRTPWTLANDRVWERTHRLGGRICVAYGLATALAGLFAPVWAGLGVLIGGALGLAIWSMAYSCYLYHRIGKAESIA